MSGTEAVGHDDVSRADEVRRGMEQAETGETAGAGRVERLREADPAGVEAVEQEAADGPKGRGLSR